MYMLIVILKSVSLILKDTQNVCTVNILKSGPIWKEKKLPNLKILMYHTKITTNSFFVHLKSCLLDFPKHLNFQDITKLQNCLHPTFLPVPVHDHHFSVSLYFFIFHTLLSNKKIKSILNVDVKIDYEILQLENLIFKS